VNLQALNNKAVGYESDLWALGCIVYQMLHGKPPFRAGSEYLIFQKVSVGIYTMQDSFPEAAKDLITSLLLLDPESRLGQPTRSELQKDSSFKEGSMPILSGQTTRLPQQRTSRAQ
jgi:serine/threonine protein kinase